MFEFNQDEIAEKKRRIRGLLEQRNLSAVYLKKSSNFAWVTAGGYSIVGLGTEVGIAGVLITRNKEYVICNNIETLRLEREEGVVRQGYEIVSFPWNEDREAKIVADLAGGAVGADLGFPGATDVSSAINPLRYSLTPWEVERLKVQALETSRIAEETALGIRPGEEERAVVGRLSEKLWKAGMDFIVAFCAADERIGLYRHAIATDKKIEKRAMISVNSRKRGLIVSITRFVQFGKLPADLAKRYEDNVYVDSAMMAATIPGRPASEVFAAALKAYAEKGYPGEYRLHHQGGSIGYFGRDYKATAATKDIIQENQAFTWNPSITGVKSEDTMLATSAGPIVLSTPVLFPEFKASYGGYNFSRPAIMEL
ncbi:MAG: M24 family metallopeptidase [Spirochaetia bacterium]|nr:M24 family metallopeptidase [Spirochaetia bacterium]MCE1208056.1 M24 family metallopeptidase [Spirochaetia bacterium]